MGRCGKLILLYGIILVPLSGIFFPKAWTIQADALQALFVLLMVCGIRSFKRRERYAVLKFLIFLVVIQGLAVLFSHGTRLQYGFSASPNQSGVFFGTTLPIVVRLFPIALPLSILGLLYAKTTSAWIGALFGVGFLFSYSKHRKYVLLVVISLTALFFLKFETISKPALEERFLLYKNTIRSSVIGEIPLYFGDKTITAKWNPLIGAGYGSFKQLSPNSQSGYLPEADRNKAHRYKHAHNDYLEIFFEFGWLGLCAVVIFILILIKSFRNAKKSETLMIVSSCLVAQMVMSLGIFTIHTATSGMLFIIMLGLYFGEIK